MAKRKVVGFDETNARLTVPGAGDTYSLEKDVEMTAGVTIGGVQRNTWPSPGSSTVGIDDVLINGDVTTRRATLGGVDFAAVSSLMLPLTIINYDTFDNSKDSAWIDKCSDKSWEKEARSTVGKASTGVGYASAALAVAAGGVVGECFYNTTISQFEEITGATTSVVTYRAGSRKYPMRGSVTVEAGRVIIWDTTGGAPTMWMVFMGTSANMIALGNFTSVAILRNTLVVGDGSWGYQHVDMTADGHQGNYGKYKGNIAQRNDGLGRDNRAKIAASNIVNDVAITYLPDAPLDEYGMRIPTIAVATDGGVSVIKDDGNVWDITCSNAAYTQSKIVSFDSDNRLTISLGDAGHATGSYAYVFNTLPVADNVITLNTKIGTTQNADAAYSSHTTINNDLYLNGPLVYGAPASRVGDAFYGANTTGVSLIKENPTTSVSGMVAYLTSIYNTGYMVGDIRRCYLANSLTADRSVKAGTLTMVGTVTETVNAGGANEYSNLTALNYLQEAATSVDYNAIGIADFSVVALIKTSIPTASAGQFFEIGNIAGDYIIGYINNNVVSLQYTVGASGLIIRSGVTPINDGKYHHIVIQRRSGNIEFAVDGKITNSIADTSDLTIPTALLRVGGGLSVWNSGLNTADPSGRMKLFRYSLTSMSPEQIASMYAQERPLFEAGTKCLLSNSSSVTDLRYNSEHDVYYVENGTNVDEFKGLQRLDYMPLATGVTASGEPLAAPYLSRSGTTNYWKAPAIDVNSELKALALDNAELRQKPSTFGFNGDGATLSFSLQQGFKPQSVYVAGSRKFEGSTSDYTVGFDGFIYSVVFAVAPATGTNNIIIEGVRA